MRDMCDPQGNNPILGHTQRLKKVLRVLTCAKNAPQRPKKMQIPRGYQNKMFILWKFCDYFDKVEISVLRWVGCIPQKSAHFLQRPQHKSTSDPVGAPKNNQFGASFIEFGDTKKCFTFSLL